MQLKGKTAIITGAGRGIGKAVALKLGNMGANIVLNGTTASGSVDAAKEEFEAAGINVVVAKGDVSNPEDVENMVKTAMDAFGRIDILVNNAGITRDMLMLKMSEKDWDDVLDINLKGAFLCTKAVSKIMLKQKSGKIINITSVAGVMGNAGQANYSASKAGLIGLTKATAKEFAAKGICCNAVAPGIIITSMTDVLPDKVKETYLNNIPLKRFGTPEEVANVVGFLASDDSNYITGQVINIDGGLVM
ncbi:MAG TPA: 3-oxoacyl-[acyl-carrier-protein] reductase [Acetivibrio sp.]|uniref:3-oxoacyl-[acyl-carrier-protein] reductase n=1 Tax=Acetivibrio sp. TaxID=1872092 RepID=UPI002C943F2A|nr:3-oxoacyl-[acyl-carrier-protein] reductase [Acetivibrio sp.]HOM02614.1 3-oxoacyl-[acyl-carrier-protein] reductase [Acetivibrio sp.]